ncbi:MAG: ribosome silencing factor [Sterolibacterium sp.]|nr:ribosome silencing factor [Sterolibacterium sp.]
MDVRKLQKIAVTALEDIKGRDIEVINTRKLSPLFERIIIASADSTRQVKALARNVHDKVKEAGGEVVGLEGEEAGEWVLVDLGSIVVHVMQPAIRSHYNLEELWQAAPASSRSRSAPKTPPLEEDATEDASASPEFTTVAAAAPARTPRAPTPRATRTPRNAPPEA